MKNVKLFYMNGEIRSLFEAEVDKRVRKEYSVRAEREITQNMLVNPEAAVEYSKRVLAIKCEVKYEIEKILGFPVEVGFDPGTVVKALTDRVGDLETTQNELNEALTMILEGVTE